MALLKETYEKKAVAVLKEKFGYTNVYAVPKIEKVVVNTGLGRLMTGRTNTEQQKLVEVVTKDLSAVIGQKPAIRPAKKSIASFKLRAGMPIGVMTTLRGKKMHDFLDRLIHIVLPRSRDFRGLSERAVDESGNLTIGVKEIIFFPELAPENVQNNIGLEVTIVTTAESKEEGLELFRQLGFPFQTHNNG